MHQLPYRNPKTGPPPLDGQTREHLLSVPLAWTAVILTVTGVLLLLMAGLNRRSVPFVLALFFLLPAFPVSALATAFSWSANRYSNNAFPRSWFRISLTCLTVSAIFLILSCAGFR